MLIVALPVKNEVKSIATTIESLRGACDGVLVYDTGSTDGTIDFVRDFVREKFEYREDFKVWLVHGTFQDYAQLRNCAHQAAEKKLSPDWVLSMSADESLVGGEHLRAFLEGYGGNENALLVEVRTASGAIDFPRLLRAKSPWIYVGKIHECPRNMLDPSYEPKVRIPNCWIEHKSTDPARNLQRLREVDVPLLRREVDESTDPVARARAIAHLGGAMEALGGEDNGSVADRSQAMFSALGWYALALADETTPADLRPHASFRLLQVAQTLGLYHSHEMVTRLTPLLARETPEVAYTYVACLYEIAISLTPHANGKPDLAAASDETRSLWVGTLDHARRAAEIARAAIRDPRRPHDPHGLLWRPWLVAARCARVLNDEAAAVDAASSGLAAGGPLEEFADFVPLKEMQ